MASITLRKEEIEKQKGMVILPIKEYQKLLGIPTYYLMGKEAEKLDRLVEKGLEDERRGRTIEASSLKDALRKHGKKHRAR